MPEPPFEELAEPLPTQAERSFVAKVNVPSSAKLSVPDTVPTIRQPRTVSSATATFSGTVAGTKPLPTLKT
jgi:hypothetical protein